MEKNKGYIHLYTGNGKGKTTAALGMALRASGAGLRSLIIQFMKGQHYSELAAVQRLNSRITIEQYGSRKFCLPEDKDRAHHRQLARAGLSRARAALADPALDLVVCDEIVTAAYFKLVDEADVMALLDARHPAPEIVLTGRHAWPQMVGLCDLVPEMGEHRHYYAAGVAARPGIES